MAGLYDLKAIRAGAYADPEIYPNDVIVVGESVGRRIFKDALQIVPLITTPIVGILVSSLNNRTQTVQSSSTTSQ
jgi:polysaccharide export outer membrane protein